MTWIWKLYFLSYQQFRENKSILSKVLFPVNLIRSKNIRNYFLKLLFETPNVLNALSQSKTETKNASCAADEYPILASRGEREMGRKDMWQTDGYTPQGDIKDCWKP